MKEIGYLPVRESLGYNNVKQALNIVFSIDLDTLPVTTGQFEDFGFIIEYNSIQIDMGISSTGKNLQFNIGEGGTFDVLLPNPNYPEKSFMSRRFFYNFIDDSHIKENVKYALGKDEKAIEYTMHILKDYLDSDAAKVLLKNNGS
ncbi:hypothetical protein [Streptococcus acidominimus]|uniref:Uncharacterized protein n=1 Tax=Streptococcus acidominimus TaxID=1326 RepID=A0A1Q8EFW6_STRAI|nr:hypothetical protein [Streptococcus acidominimus]MBF0848309.1 hypothetical protein [Streptococcus danieliae]MBF0818406.1 hypothetical protein [Streptococcus acidominimus]MBF0838595.1 hypothetical protein [Streptococcus acidominimus]MBF0839264.1 hypothetical protein [Streptococcus acidominimus]OLF50684.1 hypothetical protein BU200_00415 [Streptococcus acidominimus]